MQTLSRLFPVDCVLLFNLACFLFLFSGSFWPSGTERRGELRYCFDSLLFLFTAKLLQLRADQSLAVIKVPSLISAVCFTFQL